MIRIHVRRGLVGDLEAERFEEDWDGSQTPRTVRERSRTVRPEWEGVPLAVAVNGHLVGEELLDELLGDDVDVVVTPALGGIGEIVLFVLLSTVVSSAVSYLVSLLVPPPKPPGQPQERGDATSATYAWDGVQTNYGQGFPVPIGWGEHDVGGQVVWTAIIPSGATGTSEGLVIILALCEGPIESIGDIAGDFDFRTGSFGNAIPANIRVNENRLDHLSTTPGVTAFGRMGNLNQPILPAPFAGAVTTFSVGEKLADAGDSAVFTFVGTDALSAASVVIAFPSGCFEQDPSGGIQPAPVTFLFEWRPQGAVTGFRAFKDFQGGNVGPTTFGQQAVQGAFSESLTGFFDPPGTSIEFAQTGPVEIRLTRTSAAVGTTASDVAIFRQAVFQVPGSFEYPRTALLGLVLDAGEKVSGGLPSFVIRAKLKKVRPWHPTAGWGPLGWEVPTASPWSSLYQYPIGNNPALVCLQFLLDPACLGHYVKEENVDLETFLNWSVYCDQQPGPSGSEWSEPRFRFDGVMDRPRPAWEWVFAICRAGRAAPIIRGNKISVRYQYRDAHSAGGVVSVPAKARTQLFSDANVADVQVEYVNRGDRPTVIEWQFLNRDKDYRQDTYPIEESESYLSHVPETAPLRTRDFRRETSQAFGVTRSTQLFRDAVFQFRFQRLVRKILSFRTGIWALALEPGDVFGFQHDVLRPHPTQAFGFTIAEGGTNTTTVKTDRELTATGGTDRLIMRGPTGDVIDEEVVSIVGTTVTLANPVTVNPGAPAAFGREDQIVEDYEVLDINLTRDQRRTVRATQWVPEVHEEPISGAGGTLDSSFELDPGQADTLLVPAKIDATEISATASLSKPGSYRIGWLTPAGLERRRCRVYVRPEGGSRWWHLGEFRAQENEVWTEAFGPWQTIEVVVSIEDDRGTFALPAELDVAVLELEEFPNHSPPNLSNLVVSSEDEGLLIKWDPVTSPELAYYEVRAGEDWVGAFKVYRGREPWFLWRNPPKESDGLFVAARGRSGLYSLKPSRIAALADYLPAGTIEAATAIDEIPPNNSIPDELVSTSSPGYPAVIIGEGKYGNVSSWYTADELDLGFVGRAYWSVSANVIEFDSATVDDWAFPIDSGEARWQTVNAREASPAKPGVDLEVLVDDLAVTLDDLPDTLTVAGQRGEAGRNVWLLIQSRYHDGTSYGAWAPHENGWRKAQKIEVRYRLIRSTLTHVAHLKRFTIAAAI